ncbi:hypothetical protein FNJ84_02865 [Paracoccus sp. M683]|uniref:GFA family protein n=1 Tax=Paracoccus sp. M683 TaxID=2594268 RepID=UPI00117E427F|nr:GFA family protein [Paracoccus sp. M683]TRW99635.1 hypothetical protein FNJ84_02865 [Paracoccus sp. M683]
MIRGSCLCGGVCFSGDAESPRVTICHCSRCRKWTGHVVAAFHMGSPQINGEVTWFQSSETGERGFCPTCGASLFWRQIGGADGGVAVSAGAVDSPTGLQLAGHIWVEDKGDYYDIADDLPRITGPVRWFRSSDRAERGFCPACGSSLFWRLDGREAISVSAGAVTNPTGLRLGEHIWTDDKGDYYDIADGLPQTAME